MTQAVEVLVLVQRLRREAAQRGDSELANDLRLACRYLRQYAAQWIAVEAERTRDVGAQRRLIAEAADLSRPGSRDGETGRQSGRLWGSQMDYTKLTIAEIANGISKTETAIRWCREILDDLQEPKTVGMHAVVKVIRDLLPKLEEDLKALGKAYTRATKRNV